jgi:agmatine deiminase
MEPLIADPNREAMNSIIADLKSAKLEVVTVPSPGAVLDAAGALTPASYMNFYIANSTVVVPVYGSRSDDAAVAAIAKMFPTRRVVAADGKAVVIGGGAFHCATQQQPSIGKGSL